MADERFLGVAGGCLGRVVGVEVAAGGGAVAVGVDGVDVDVVGEGAEGLVGEGEEIDVEVYLGCC